MTDSSGAHLVSSGSIKLALTVNGRWIIWWDVSRSIAASVLLSASFGFFSTAGDGRYGLRCETTEVPIWHWRNGICNGWLLVGMLYKLGIYSLCKKTFYECCPDPMLSAGDYCAVQRLRICVIRGDSGKQDFFQIYLLTSKWTNKYITNSWRLALLFLFSLLWKPQHDPCIITTLGMHSSN